jgi:hypothetical protein
LWALGVLVTFGSLSACHPGQPSIDTGPKPVQLDGTITGTVRGPEGAAPIEGRIVEVINQATGEKLETTTSTIGGFTFKVQPGKYVVQVALHEGEMLIRRPDVVSVNRRGNDTQADFLIAPARALRPRYHAPRGDDGLGAGIA